MTLTSKVGDCVGGAIEKIEDRAASLPDEIDAARKTLSDLGGRARETVRRHPGLAVVGAFAIGYAIAKVARHT